MVDFATSRSPDAEPLSAVASFLAARRLVYLFLARAFSGEPDAEWIRAIRFEGLLDSLPFENVSEEFLRGRTLLLRGSDEPGEELRSDFTRLLIGPGPLPAAPWESVVRGEERLTFGEETSAVRAFYRRHGFELERLGREPDDHVAIELEFMGRLASASLRDLEEDPGGLGPGLAAQLEFLEDHLLRWAPKFSEDLAKNAATDFYRGLALILSEFLVYDARALSEIIHEAS